MRTRYTEMYCLRPLSAPDAPPAEYGLLTASAPALALQVRLPARLGRPLLPRPGCGPVVALADRPAAAPVGAAPGVQHGAAAGAGHLPGVAVRLLEGAARVLRGGHRRQHVSTCMCVCVCVCM